MKKRILVVGGTGMLGRPVSHGLNEAGYQVRVMTRDGRKAREFFDNSFEVFAGNPLDVRCLEEALDGCVGIHISLPTEVEQQVAETVASIAPRKGVQRITYISGATVAEENRWIPIVNRKYLAEKAVAESGAPYTILCPTWVMESLPMFVNQDRATLFGKQSVPYHWVAAEDVASMVSTAYGIGGDATGRFIVHGPEAIQMREALQRYCAAFHPEVREVTSMPFWLVKLLAAVTRNHGLKGAGELMSYFEKVGEGDQKPSVNCVLGTPATTLDRWLQDRKAVDDRCRTPRKDLNLVTVP